MIPDTQTIADKIAFCRDKIDRCSDAIIQLQGELPEGFTFTISIKSAPILSFDMSEDEANFAVGVFMSWHSFFSRRLKVLTREMELQPK